MTVKLRGTKRITGKRIVKEEPIPVHPTWPAARLVCNVHPKHIAGDPPYHVFKGGLILSERGCTCMEIYKAMYGMAALMNRAYDNGRDDPRVRGGPFGDMR